MNFLITIILALFFSFFPLLKVDFKSKKFLKDNKYYLLAFFILFIGSFVRLFLIGKYPVGFNQDEASIGYETYSLITNGIDRNGMSYPVNFISWGSGQNALYAYLSYPFIKIFGLSVLSTRLPMALIGCLTLLVIYIFVNKAFNKKEALIFLFIFTILPWHILKSRWALEANLFPDFIIYSLVLIYFGLKNKKKKYFIFSSIIFGLSTYSYGTSYLFVPVFLIILYLFLIKTKKITLKEALLYFSITGLVSLPMILYVIINFLELDSIKIFNITIPKLYENRMQNDTLLNGNIIGTLLDNIMKLLTITLLQQDATLYNSIKYFGLYYYFSLPILGYGFYTCFKEKKNIYFKIMSIFLIASILTALFIPPNINRANIIWIPISFYLCYGTIMLFKNIKKLYKITLFLYATSFILFNIYYFTQYKYDLKQYSYYGLGEAIQYSDKIGYKNLYITSSINQPYIFYLFFNRTDTNYYIKNKINTYNDDDREVVISIKNVYFYVPTIPSSGDVIIVNDYDGIEYPTCEKKQIYNMKVFKC